MAAKINWRQNYVAVTLCTLCVQVTSQLDLSGNGSSETMYDDGGRNLLSDSQVLISLVIHGL